MVALSMLIGYVHGRKDGKRAMARAVIKAINEKPIDNTGKSEGAD